MNYLSVEKISKSFHHERILFKDISLGLSQGDKFALVGHNGAGKSTLLKILAGELESDSGTLAIRNGIKVSYLSQQPKIPGQNMAIKDLIFSDDNEISRTVKEYEDLIHGPEGEQGDRLHEVLIKMEELQAWDYESRVNEVLGKLGITQTDTPLESLSGGQRKRVFLAKMILSMPDVMILDEPTNHLDLEAIEWLENYLSGQNITFIMVTHDRYFLDNTVTGIIELDRGKLFHYQGNYAYFLEKKAEREEMLKSEVEKAKNLLRKELEWMRRQPKARGTKSKYRVEAFYDIQEKASQNLRKDKMELDIKERRQGGKILEINNLTKHYGALNIVDGFSYIFKKKDRIGIVGKNGVGKSTFLDLITGKTLPSGGEIDRGLTTGIGYFTQETAASLDPTHRVIEEVLSIAEFIVLSDGTQVSASKFLDFFLFPPEKQYTFIEKLSGGEKKRLQLLKVLIKNPNFLILDEPTNDFDIDTLNVLEDFLEKFSGCLLLVSHDRYFMDRLVDQLFVFEGNGVISLFNGNYSDYRSLEEEKKLEVKPDKPVPEKQTKGNGRERKKLSFQEKKEYEELPLEIERLENQKKELEALLSNGSADVQKVLEWSGQFSHVEKALESKTIRWMELDELQQA